MSQAHVHPVFLLGLYMQWGLIVFRVVGYPASWQGPGHREVCASIDRSLQQLELEGRQLETIVLPAAAVGLRLVEGTKGPGVSKG